MASTLDNIITEDDCHTKHGIDLPISNHEDVYTRALSRDQHGFKKNTQVTPQMVSALHKKGVETISVRSPLKCVARKGTCSQCFGLDEHGVLPAVGENIGVKAGQSMSEPLTQFIMKAFHTGGLAGETATAKGFERVSQLLKMPKYVAGEATLAKSLGKVTSIKKLQSGGQEIHIEEESHSVPPGRNLKVKVGDQVNRGDALTTGVIKPQELMRLKDSLPAAQNYIVDELQAAYKNQGVNMQRKVFETVIRSAGNSTRVVKAPKDSGFVEGEFIPHTTAQHYNENRGLTLPTVDAVGYKLQSEIGNLPRFHEITDKDVSHIKGLGYNQVDVVKDPLVHAPDLKGIERLPLSKKNWMAQLGYREVKKALTTGAAEAWKTNVEGTHPVPAFAYGVTFGKKKEHY